MAALPHHNYLISARTCDSYIQPPQASHHLKTVMFYLPNPGAVKFNKPVAEKQASNATAVCGASYFFPCMLSSHRMLVRNQPIATKHTRNRQMRLRQVLSGDALPVVEPLTNPKGELHSCNSFSMLCVVLIACSYQSMTLTQGPQMTVLQVLSAASRHQLDEALPPRHIVS
jgi:hypothetical protein